MDEGDSSDSDVIGPPLPPGFSSKSGGNSGEPSHSQRDEEGESEEEDGEDESVSDNELISVLLFRVFPIECIYTIGENYLLKEE